jgi:uncharacterized protein
MYCGHCLPCPAGIDVPAVMRLIDEAAGGMTESVRREFAGLERSAADCTACGVCEERCPFGIDVVSAMEKARTVFR